MGRLDAAGQTVEPLIAVDNDTTIRQIRERAGNHRGRCLLVVADKTTDGGWLLTWWEPAT